MIKKSIIFLDRFHWLWLAIAAPFMIFPTPRRSLAMLIIPGLFLLRWIVIMIKQKTGSIYKGKVDENHLPLLPSTPLNGSLLLMSLMILASLWVTFDINYSLPKISGVLLGIAVFLALAREGIKVRGWIFGLSIFLALGLLIAIVGIFGTSWFNLSKIAFFGSITTHLPQMIKGIQGAEAGFHPNEVAGSLIWVVPLITSVNAILLIRLFQKSNTKVDSKKRQKIFINIVLAVLISAINIFITGVFILCQSRGGYIALAVTFIVLVPFSIPPRFRPYLLIFLVTMGIILGILFALRWDAVSTWITGSNLKADPALSLNSLSGRIEVWSRAIYGIQDFPFTGMGMNAFRKVMPVLYPLFNISPEIDLGHAHNEFLQAALDLGIPGLIAFLAFYIGCFWMLADTWKISSRSLNSSKDMSLVIRLLTLGLSGSLFAHMLYGLTDAVALGAKPGILFWILMGLITTLHQQLKANLRNTEGVTCLPESEHQL